LQTSSSDPSRANFLLWSALQQELYHLDSKNVDQSPEALSVIMLDSILQDKRTPDQLNKELQWYLGYKVDTLNCFYLLMFIISIDCKFRKKMCTIIEYHA